MLPLRESRHATHGSYIRVVRTLHQPIKKFYRDELIHLCVTAETDGLLIRVNCPGEAHTSVWIRAS